MVSSTRGGAYLSLPKTHGTDGIAPVQDRFASLHLGQMMPVKFAGVTWFRNHIGTIALRHVPNALRHIANGRAVMPIADVTYRVQRLRPSVRLLFLALRKALSLSAE
jgi:hypothetical protein